MSELIMDPEFNGTYAPEKLSLEQEIDFHSPEPLAPATDPEAMDQNLHFTSPENPTLADIPEEYRKYDHEEIILPGAAAGFVISVDPKVYFRGGYTCGCVAKSLPYVEADMIKKGLIKKNIDIYQLGYNPGRVAASAGTHDKGMMIDVGQFSYEQLRVWRTWGWNMQHRTRAQGFSGDHGHGGPIGCTHGASLAMWQMDQYVKNYRNGLTSNAPVTGPKVAVIRWPDAIEKYVLKPAAAAAASKTTTVRPPLPATGDGRDLSKTVGKGRPISFQWTMANRGKPNGNVAIIQDILSQQKQKNGVAFYPYKVDGVYGPATVAAVGAYQRAIGFSGRDADGILGWTSFSKLVSWQGWVPVR